MLLHIMMIIPGSAQISKVVLYFENRAGDKAIQADSVYENASGETFTVRNFKYYISNIVLHDGNKIQSFPGEYFLIDNNESSSKQIQLSTTLKALTSIQFILGVDSLQNVKGVQTGSLDPAKGMFWTWNTGYVMAKLEGNSPFANTPAHSFSYHVGGYKHKENAAREIHLIIAQDTGFTNKNYSITIAADVLKWFDSEHKIKIAETPFCHEPGTLATRLADNYANMFRIAELK